MYGPGTAAVASLTVRALRSPDGAPLARGRIRPFLINWRIPGWAAVDGLRVAVNGQVNDACARGAAAAAARRVGGGAPPFGEGASFCSVGPNWRDGDLREPGRHLACCLAPLTHVPCYDTLAAKRAAGSAL
jgi:hypothetical protein